MSTKSNEFTLSLVVVCARKLKNISTFGKLDPYVRIIYGTEKYRTSVIKDGGCSPSKIFFFFTMQYGTMKLLC